ncbi:hypothetical protein CRYUN_Cryun01aG0148900 [Craigia yunnanensis]
MAAPKTPSTVAETYAKSHYFLLFLTLFFIFLLLVNPTSNPTNSSNVTSSIPFKRLLLDTSSKSTSSTMNLHPKQTRNAHTSSSSSSSSKSSRTEFGAEAHEVPSGPNPISNSSAINTACPLCEEFVTFVLKLVLFFWGGDGLKIPSFLLLISWVGYDSPSGLLASFW